MKRLWWVLVALSTFACSRRQEPTAARCEPADVGSPVDPMLLAFLSRARAAHHVADNQEAVDDLAAAIVPLANLVSGPLPHATAAQLAPEVREVLADTRARLADLRSRLGAFEPALADIRAGLESARDANYFRGHLLETEGLVEERHARALDATDKTAAAATRRRAIDLLEQAMAVQSRVIQSGPRPVDGEFPAASAEPAGSAR